MFIKSLTIKNLKCFGNNDNFIKFKIPKKEISGSGLNILVGKNNSGKSTILEAIKYAKNYKSQQVDEEIINSKSRNNKNDLEIKILSSKNKILKFKSCLYQSDYRKHNFESEKEEFAPNLYHSNTNRYIKKKDSFSNLASRQNEGRTEEKLEKRDVYWMIQEIEIASDNQRKEFDKIISDYFSDILRIQIGSRSREDSCRIFCEMKSGDSVDLQDMGSGIEQLIILIWIIKYGSKGEIILIDEPELSLHPQAQKNFLDFLKEESRIKQIFISTHSPYFIDVNIIQNVLRFENNNLKKGARSFRIKKKKFVDKIKENRNFFFHHRTLFFTDVAIFMEGAEDYDRYSKFCENNGFSNLIDSFYMMNGCDPTLFFEEFCIQFGIKFFAIVDKDFSITRSKWSRGNRKKFISDIKQFIKDKQIDFDDIKFNQELVSELKETPRLDERKAEEIDINGTKILKVEKKNIFVLRQGEIKDYLKKDGTVVEDNQNDKIKELNAIFGLINKGY